MALKLLCVAGARPNFVKVAAICEAVREVNRTSVCEELQHVLVHTGQHYDASMSDFFFNDLDLPKPDIFLGVGSASHSVQTARIMERFESVLFQEKPDVVLVVGDVNSTLACALVAKKTSWLLGEEAFIPKLAHVEAGLRSFDRTMPEEINRMVTDALSDYLFTTEESANRNLIREGIPTERIHFVGNVMIDTLLRHRAKAEASPILSDLRLSRNGTKPDQFAVLTLHRPGNVEHKVTLCRILEALLEITRHVPVIFPAHPRTVKKLHEWNLGDFFVTDSVERENRRRGIRLIPPLGYLDFLKLMSHARVILTDSGGIQEEATVLGVPCLTLRDNTERPVTITQGTNVLVGAADPRRLVSEFEKVLQGERKAPTSPVYWDGKAAQRIVRILVGDHLAKPSVDSSQLSDSEALRDKTSYHRFPS